MVPFAPPVAKSAIRHTQADQNFIHAVPPGMNPFLPPSDAMELGDKSSVNHPDPVPETTAAATSASSAAPQEQRQRRPLPRPKPNQGKAAQLSKPEDAAASKPEVSSSVIEFSDLPPEFSSQDAREVCDQYGKIERARCVQPGRVQVAFASPSQASKALSGLAGLKVPGTGGMQAVRCRLADEDLTEEPEEKGDDRAAPWHKMRRSHKDRHGGWSDNDKLQLRDEVSVRLTEMGNWKLSERTQRKLAKLTQHVVHEVTAQTETDAHDRMLGLYKMLTTALGEDRAQAFGIWLAERLQKLSVIAAQSSAKEKKKDKDGIQPKMSQQQQQRNQDQQQDQDQDQAPAANVLAPPPVSSPSQPPYKAPPAKAPAAAKYEEEVGKRPADSWQHSGEGPPPSHEDEDQDAIRPTKVPKLGNSPGMPGLQFHKSEPPKAPASVANLAVASKPSSPPKLRHQMYYDTWDDLADAETAGSAKEGATDTTQELQEGLVDDAVEAGTEDLDGDKSGLPSVPKVVPNRVLAPKLSSPPPKTTTQLVSTAAFATEAATHKVLPAVKAPIQPKPAANLGTPKVIQKPPSAAEQGARPKALIQAPDTVGLAGLGFQSGLPPFNMAKGGAQPPGKGPPQVSPLQPCPQVEPFPPLPPGVSAEPALSSFASPRGLQLRPTGGFPRPENTVAAEAKPQPLSWPATGLQAGLPQGTLSGPLLGMSLPGKQPPVRAPSPGQVVLPPGFGQSGCRPRGPEIELSLAAAGVAPMETDRGPEIAGGAVPASGNVQATAGSWENLTTAWSDFLAKPPQGPAQMSTEALPQLRPQLQVQSQPQVQQPLQQLQQQLQQLPQQQPLQPQQAVPEQQPQPQPQIELKQQEPPATPQQPQQQQPQVVEKEPPTSVSQTTQEQQIMQQEILSLIQEQMTSRRREGGSTGQQPSTDQGAAAAEQPQPQQTAQTQPAQQPAEPEQAAQPEQPQAQQVQGQQQQQLYQQLEQRIQQHAMLQHQMLMQQVMLQQVLQQNPQSLQAQAAAAQVQQLALMMQMEERKRLVAQQALGQS